MPDTDIQERLRSVPLFSSLSKKQIRRIAEAGKRVELPEGRVVAREDHSGEGFHVILEGKVSIEVHGQHRATLGPGKFFGEMSLIDGEPRSADARAYSGSLTVLALDQSTVHEVLSMDPEAALEFLQLLCRLIANRLREIDDKVIGWRIMSGERNESVVSA